MKNIFIKIFWSKQMKWFRKLLGVDDLDIFSVVEGEVPLYTLGSRVPRGFPSFSGVDVKVYFEDELGRFLCVTEVQSISCRYNNLHENIEGTITSLIFSGDVLSYLPFKPKNLLMVAANEYGTLCYHKFYNIVLGEITWDMSVDTIVCDIKRTFTAQRCVSWKSVSDTYLYENWENNLPELIQKRLSKYI